MIRLFLGESGELFPELCLDLDLDLAEVDLGLTSSSSGNLNPNNCISLNAKFPPNGAQETLMLQAMSKLSSKSSISEGKCHLF